MPEHPPTLDVPPATLLVDYPSTTGENPLWHDDEQALFWVDISPGRLFRFDPATGHNALAHAHDGLIGGFTIQADGSLLLFCEGGAIVHWRDGATTTVIDGIDRERDTRFNDVIADPEGRVYCGTMPGPGHLAALYRLDPDATLTLLFDDVGLSNGMGFTDDRRWMYHTDSRNRVINRLAWDAVTGALGDRIPVVRTPDDGTVPDGMTLDTDGTIWSARYGGGGVFRYAADGAAMGFVPIPAPSVTSITFGGADLATTFVTTAGGDRRDAGQGPLAGSLFGLDLGVRGRPPFRSRIRV